MEQINDEDLQLRNNFKSLPEDIRRSIFLRFPWNNFWKLFILNKHYEYKYNTKSFWYEKAYIDIIDYFTIYPNRWCLDYSKNNIIDKFNDIFTIINDINLEEIKCKCGEPHCKRCKKCKRSKYHKQRCRNSKRSESESNDSSLSTSYSDDEGIF